MFFVNLYTAPIAEWTDRDKAVAAVRLGLKIPAYPSPSPAGEVVFAFGAAGKTLGLLVGLSRYRLYDADAAISRSVAYLAMAVGMVVLFGVFAASSIRSGSSTSAATSVASRACGARCCRHWSSSRCTRG